MEGDYYLLHNLDKEISINFTGGKGNNPKYFRIEISEDEFMTYLERVVSYLNNNTLTNKCTYLLSMHLDQQQYSEFVALNLPAKKYELNFSYNLSSLVGIETLKSLSFGKGCFETKIATFNLPGNDSAIINVLTDKTGHKLELVLLYPEYFDQIRKPLGIEFVKKMEGKWDIL